MGSLALLCPTPGLAAASSRGLGLSVGCFCSCEAGAAYVTACPRKVGPGSNEILPMANRHFPAVNKGSLDPRGDGPQPPPPLCPGWHSMPTTPVLPQCCLQVQALPREGCRGQSRHLWAGARSPWGDPLLTWLGL
ncbi:unnamed protein product [Natator depressus]